MYYRDQDVTETQEWQDAFAAVIRHAGADRAAFLLRRLFEQAVASHLPITRLNTPYRNSIAVDEQPAMPGDSYMERRIRALIRWNALAMVLRANRDADLGGHLATFASSATLYDVGFNHFFRAPTEHHGGDLIYYQGHSAPGIYARSFLEGRLTESQLDNFRREVKGNGLSSYPHPYLMPDYWQFPTVSMGLGPILSIYQAHIQKYLINRGLLEEQKRKIWAFLGDGEMDEPESLGAIALAGREKLDNLIWVINCNLQRLDGPVRGNGKIIQELESIFLGAGWKVIKVVWGDRWDPLLAQDDTGALQQRMDEVLDGDYQTCKAKGGAFTREHFFGKYPETANMVADLSDEDIANLNRGGHDPVKVYAAYAAAIKTEGQPVVILAKTVKGYGLSTEIQAVNKTHQIKKMTEESLRYFRSRFDLPFKEEELADLPLYKLEPDSPEMKYLQARRQALGGYLPQRRHGHIPLDIPPLSDFQSVLAGSGDKEYSTTMVLVRILSILLKNANIGKRVVPIVPDEARTFGLEGMFRQLGIYSALGQQYTPEDHEALMGYRESSTGHMLEEGINEAGATSAWTALGTSYSTNALPMIPMYLFYSMFGFQRVGDLLWAAGDSQAQGFLFGATAGRTTLNGEGLQHQDGHSLLLAATVPNCISYDPCFGYELAIIVQDGLRRMYGPEELGGGERVYYYITLMNENYMQPAITDAAVPVEQVETGVKKGMYLLQQRDDATVQLMGAGVILREVIRAGEILQEDYGIAANIWSVTSFTELARDGMTCERANRLQPGADNAQQCWVQQQLQGHPGLIVATSDYQRLVAEQIRPYLPVDRPYLTLGTDGFGRSDTREQLRDFFEVSAAHIVLATLSWLADDGEIDPSIVLDVFHRFGINNDVLPPWQARQNSHALQSESEVVPAENTEVAAADQTDNTEGAAKDADKLTEQDVAPQAHAEADDIPGQADQSQGQEVQ